MKRINWIKRVTSFILVFMMVFGMMPWQNISVRAQDIGEGLIVDSVELFKSYDEKNNIKMFIKVIAKNGSDISTLQVKYEDRNGYPKALTKDDAVSSKTSVIFEFPKEQINDFTGIIFLNDYALRDLTFSGIPTVIQAVPKNINISQTTPKPSLTINGSDLDKLDTIIDGYQIKGYTRVNARPTELKDMCETPAADIKKTPSSLTVENLKHPGALGTADIIFEKTKTTSDIKISVSHRYLSSFRFVQDLNIENLKMYPNVGTNGDYLYIEGKNLQKQDVYFLNINGIDGYLPENQAEFVDFKEKINKDNENRLTVKVPAGIPIGQKYNVYVTEKQDSEIIGEEKVPGVFTVVDKENKATIDDIYPPSGSDQGGYAVGIIGKNITTLNIPGLDVNYTTTDISSTSVDGTTELELKYPDGNYNGVAVTEVTRKISVVMGNQAKFQKEDGKFKFSIGSQDQISIYPQKINIEDNPIVDVTATIITTFNANGTEYKFIEMPEKKQGFEYIASSKLPIIESVTPEKIQIISNAEGKFNIKDDILLSIKGNNFLVNKYTDTSSNTSIINYPQVIFKTVNDKNLDNYEIKVYFEDGKAKVAYRQNGKTEILDKTSDGRNLDFYVLKDNRVVNGLEGNELGNRIVVKLPKEVILSIAGFKNVQVVNPTRNSSDPGQSQIKVAAVKFVNVSDNPVIESVNPDMITVEGGDAIVVKGSNFQEGCKVLIDGKEVSGVTREIDKLANQIILKFNAPPGREGETQIQVINPSGGIAIAKFTYVISFKKDPKLIDLTPKKGTNNTLVVVNGDNFLKPDSAILDTTGIGAYKLIGTRILMDGKDINKYTGPNNTPEFEDYTAPNNEILMTIVDEKIKVSDFYKNATIEDTSNKIYDFDIDENRNPYIVNKDNEKYTFKIKNGNIEGEKEDGTSYPVTLEMNKITINETTPIDLSVTMDNKILSIGKRLDGGKYVKLSDYYHSIIFKDDTGKFYSLDVNPKGSIILTGTPGANTEENKYILSLNKSGNIIATKGSDFPVTVTNEGIQMNGLTLKMQTAYAKDVKDKITGNRVKVINRNQIIFYVPNLEVEGKGAGPYDVSVKNPDTKTDTKPDSFVYFNNPQSKPIISDIYPKEGSTEGGYTITILGNDFEDTSKVYIGGVIVDKEDTQLKNKNTLIVKVPKYTGNMDELETDRVTVPVVIVNYDAGSASKEDGFTYVKPNSTPKIDRILPNEGSAAGNEIVEIWGYDFRFSEPYKNMTGGSGFDEGDTLIDLNYNNKWDSEANKSEWNIQENLPQTVKIYDKYYNSPILPKVYFNNKKAKIVEWSRGYLKVVTPENVAGEADVYIVNNDSGISNKVSYTYKSSNPKINKILPPVGRKIGQDNVEIHGEGFVSSNMNIYKDFENVESVFMPVVKFGNITNRDIPRDKDNSGRIDAGHATVNLAGNLTVYYNRDDQNLTAIIEENQKTYKAVFLKYNEEVRYIPVSLLGYPGYELIRVEVHDGRLIVERGYAPETKLISSEQMQLKTPSYYTIGKVPVTIMNPDGGSATGEFEYKNPDSHPQITEITREGQASIVDNINGKDVKVVKVNYKGGSIISVKGSDFRENAKISIGDIMEIDYENINPDLPSKLTFKIDGVDESEIGKLHKVVVQNEDGAFASSDDENLDIPIYIVFTKGETSPKIDTITPDRGLSKGGETVVIKGLDFRETMEGYEPKKIAVYFGEIKVEEKYIKFIDYRTIEVITPKSDPKTVDVKIENPDGEMSNSVEYTYLSDPDITQIVDAKDNSINISTIYVDGGQEIQIKGNDFMSGARVVFSPVLKEATDTDTDIITIDGKNYVLVSGTDGTAEFIDSQNLKVTTPAGKLGSKGVMIINPDKAGSNIYDVVYVIDQIDAPTGVKADLIYDKYIKIDWNEVKDATSYEIYAVEDDKEMYLVGTTDLTTFIYRDVKSKTDYRFIVKAIGEFGLSKGSSKSNEVTTKSHSGYEDKDGEINEKTSINRSGSTVNVLIGTDDYDEKETVIDLTKGEYAGAKEVVISIPARVATSYLAKDVKVVLSDMYVKFNPTVFNVSKLYESKDKDKAGVKFKIGINQQNASTSLSNEYELKADVFIGEDNTSIDYLKNNMDISLDFDSAKADLRRMRNISLRRYDEYKNEWTYVKQRMDNYSTSINSPVNRLGRYSIIGSRR
ncbi:IPT/TIG domain-containing protein [Tepidibacter hydrothermalis]|uniref:IPT/TIG domain-containing protein n=1 Tax=Tepidibacter hydrothermalis TaxID=3036126 RepID=A0ABY8EC53_9FIRM|nr:IPT/TIG domain-containing protein [Tepidibacter hydrothermalis]WFD10522.1 IPT/TIG domain-containing protein [Tepidibacter hydrothermalis]